jgi:hypothetical protein
LKLFEVSPTRDGPLPSTGLWACADGKSLVVVGEDVLKMTGSA